MHPESPLVSIRDHNLLGSNFYWHKFANHGLTKEDIISAGVVDDQVYVHKDLIPQLLAVDKQLQLRGWRLYVKEGYRSKKLYEIVYERRVAKYGKAETDNLFNMDAMPHASGTSVDVAIWDEKTNQEVFLRRSEDGAPALYIDYYKVKEDPDAKKYQELQEYLIGLMLDHGFQIGTKKEYFHFDYTKKI